MLLLQNNQVCWRPIKALRLLFRAKFLHFASDSSYAVYLFHGFFISLSGFLLMNFPVLAALDPAIRVGLMWFFVTICSYSLAYIIFKHVEKAGGRVGKLMITNFNKRQFEKR